MSRVKLIRPKINGLFMEKYAFISYVNEDEADVLWRMPGTSETRAPSYLLKAAKLSN